MKADTKVQSNDTAIKLVTTVVERANLKQALKTRLITADRIVGWTYLDESRIQFQTATGLLPETHGVAVKAPYDTIAGHPALFNWDGIDGSLSRGLVRRPDRTEPAEAFLYAIFDQVMEDFESEDLVRARAGFMTARDACMGCHVASDLAYINDQRMFRNLVFQ